MTDTETRAGRRYETLGAFPPSLSLREGQIAEGYLGEREEVKTVKSKKGVMVVWGFRLLDGITYSLRAPGHLDYMLRTYAKKGDHLIIKHEGTRLMKTDEGDFEGNTFSVTRVL